MQMKGGPNGPPFLSSVDYLTKTNFVFSLMMTENNTKEDIFMKMLFKNLGALLVIVLLLSGCMAQLSKEDKARLDAALKAADAASASASSAAASAKSADASADRAEAAAKRSEAAAKRAEAAAASAEDSAAKAAKAFEMGLRK